MADIALHLPDEEALALAQFCKRVDYATINRFASPTSTLYLQGRSA